MARCLAASLLAVGCARILGFEPGELNDSTTDASRGGKGASGGAPPEVPAPASGAGGAEAPSGQAGYGGAGEAGDGPSSGDCGNHELDPGEECDGDELGGGTCASQVDAAGGQLRCDAHCKLDARECYVVRSLDVSEHVCAVLSNDRLKCWGQNASGQLGLGDDENRGEEPGEMGHNLPFVDVGQRGVLEVSTGHGHTCAVVTGNQLLCWGSNSHGQLGRPGDDLQAPPQTPVDLGDVGDDFVAHVSAGGTHTCVLLHSGRVKCWGNNDHGQLGLGHDQPRGKQPGDVARLPFVDLGRDDFNQPLLVEAIDTGMNHTCTRLNTKQIKCWGYNGQGELGIGTYEENVGEAAKELGNNLRPVNLSGVEVEALSSGGDHNCIRTGEPGLKCWGFNSEGQLGYGDYASRGLFPQELGDALLDLELGLYLYPAGVSGGYAHTCAWFFPSGEANTRVKCWGSNYSGELGLGDTENRGSLGEQMGDHLPFIDLGTDREVISVHAGDHISCAHFEPGLVKCWGNNDWGAVGVGHDDDIGVNPEQMGDALPFVEL